MLDVTGARRCGESCRGKAGHVPLPPEPHAPHQLAVPVSSLLEPVLSRPDLQLLGGGGCGKEAGEEMALEPPPPF